MLLIHEVLIDRPAEDCFHLASQVERYPDFLPGYLKSRVIERQADRFLLERSALVRGRLHEWSSWVQLRPNEEILFEHAAGPLKGMQVQWLFIRQAADRTTLRIIHRFHSDRPWGWFFERFLVAPAVGGMAAQVIEGFKKTCERQEAILL